MTKSQIAAEIRTIVKNQLDDCEQSAHHIAGSETPTQRQGVSRHGAAWPGLIAAQPRGRLTGHFREPRTQLRCWDAQGTRETHVSSLRYNFQLALALLAFAIAFIVVWRVVLEILAYLLGSHLR